MEIWEERIMGKYGSYESQKSFERFRMYLLDIPRPRDLHDLTSLLLYGRIIKNPKKSNDENYNRLLQRLKELHCEYEWGERAGQYDLIEDNKRVKELNHTRFEGMKALTDKQLEISQMRINASSKLLDELNRVEKIADEDERSKRLKELNLKSKIINDCCKAYNMEIESYMDILRGVESNVNLTGNINVTGEVEHKISSVSSFFTDEAVQEIVKETQELDEKEK